MRNKNSFATQTIQSGSCVLFKKTDKYLIKNKPKAEDNRSLLLSVFDDLNNLYDLLNRLNYLIQKRKIKQNLNSELLGDKK
jgi:hypothetical protein